MGAGVDSTKRRLLQEIEQDLTRLAEIRELPDQWRSFAEGATAAADDAFERGLARGISLMAEQAAAELEQHLDINQPTPIISGLLSRLVASTPNTRRLDARDDDEPDDEPDEAGSPA